MRAAFQRLEETGASSAFGNLLIRFCRTSRISHTAFRHILIVPVNHHRKIPSIIRHIHQLEIHRRIVRTVERKLHFPRLRRVHNPFGRQPGEAIAIHLETVLELAFRHIDLEIRLVGIPVIFVILHPDAVQFQPCARRVLHLGGENHLLPSVVLVGEIHARLLS